MSETWNRGAAARFTGSNLSSRFLLGLTPQALCFRPLRGLVAQLFSTCAVTLLLSISATAQGSGVNVAAFDRPRVLKAANQYLKEAPITITASSSPRSAGGPHDFFSEGDYWWPDPKNPGGPYIQRDGMTNPDNFTRHREYMVRLSRIVPALAAAYQLTGERKYAAHAARHLRAWFVDEA